ncbi:BTAD domain-containing putative transcriptional regulator [Micromonospora sp. RP3T]|uniref:BTAD domain-containing putative transcriptional regulator n=1 Tax=Micromonospora sp. RP3T TaxID=2135446 RepID=UPI003D7644F5
MSEALRFELLGPQRAWYADRPLDLGPAKQRAVLAVLLLAAGRPVPTGQIVEAVWPEEAPVNGPNVVQKHVAGLRRVLEPDRSPRTPAQVLTLTDAGYLLRVAPEAVDVTRFERGVQRARQAQAAGRTAEALAEVHAALERWQGEPFTGFAGPWFDAARHRLVELRAVALETRTELELAAGRHGEAVGRLVELVAEFPVRERLRLQLMLALYRSGRQAEALAAYRDFADLLREDYGIEPGGSLQDLHRRILRSDPALLPPVADLPCPVSPGADAPSTTARPGPVSPPPAPRPPVSPVPGPSPAVPTSLPAAPTTAAPTSSPAAPMPLPAGWPGPAPLPHALLLALNPPPETTPRRSPTWVQVTATVFGAATVLLSFGSLTWAVVLGYALWRRSWRLALAGVSYFLLIFILVVVALNMPENEEVTDAEALYLIGTMGVCWLVGAGHVVLLNPALWAALGALFWTGRQRGDEQRRLRREQARHLLHHYPAARTELRIGRPDLLRGYDDGGLVDVNAVPEPVLATLPGLTAEQCRQLAVDRWLRGPYGSLEELAGRCHLPSSTTEPLRELLLFLPLEPSPAPPVWSAAPGRNAG